MRNPDLARGAILGTCCLLLQACTHFGKTPGDVDEAAICRSLNRVVAQADVQFKDLKGTPQLALEVSKWRAAPVFPDSECDVFQWGGGRMTFGCVWSDVDRESAQATYVRNVARAQACLGPDWTVREQAGSTGKAALFVRPGDATHVVLRYFRPRSRFLESWETSLTVGDNVTVDAR